MKENREVSEVGEVDVETCGVGVETPKKREAAERLLKSICEKDSMVRKVMTDSKTKKHVMSELEEGFDYIVINYPELVEDISRRIINYHLCVDVSGIRGIADFMRLPNWFSMYLENQPRDYWDFSGKYYGLRMSEVINFFLMAKGMEV